VGSDTVVVAASYSGNTEETLAAFDASAGLRAPRLCVTTGGALAERARRAGVPRFELPGGLQPRAALGHSLVALMLLLHEAGIVSADPLPDIEAAARQLGRVRDRCGPERAHGINPAKRLALRLHGHLPLIYTGPGPTQPVGVRWKGQLHENAKTLAATSVFPELDHNEIMGWQALPEVRRAALLVLLRDRDDGAAIARRMRITAEILSPRVAGLEWIDTEGETVLERMLGGAHLADWTSVYLAFLNGVDPTPVTEIEQLKKRLAAEAESA
jgi:glucose/mannose-6-phosphate isomerase